MYSIHYIHNVMQLATHNYCTLKVVKEKGVLRETLLQTKDAKSECKKKGAATRYHVPSVEVSTLEKLGDRSLEKTISEHNGAVKET